MTVCCNVEKHPGPPTDHDGYPAAFANASEHEKNLMIRCMMCSKLIMREHWHAAKKRFNKMYIMSRNDLLQCVKDMLIAYTLNSHWLHTFVLEPSQTRMADERTSTSLDGANELISVAARRSDLYAWCNCSKCIVCFVLLDCDHLKAEKPAESTSN